jgi:hypothetical protein
VRFYGAISNSPHAVLACSTSSAIAMANCMSCTKQGRVAMASIVKSMQPAMCVRSSRRAAS